MDFTKLKKLRITRRTAVINQDDITAKKSIGPFILIFVVAVLVAFAHGFTHAANKKIQDTFGLSKAEIAGFYAAGYAAFLVAPLTYAGWCVRHLGYHRSLIISLFFQGLGVVFLWPCVHFRSFVGLCVCNFIIGSAGALLSNILLPFVTSCGPSTWQELRILILIGGETIIEIVSTLIAGKVLYTKHESGVIASSASGTEKLQKAYLSVAVAYFVLCAIFAYIPIPQIEEKDITGDCNGNLQNIGHIRKPFYKQYFLFLGVLTKFFQIGGQGSLSVFFMQIAVDLDPRLSDAQAAQRLAVSQAVYAAGLVVYLLVIRWVRAKVRHLLLISSIVLLGFLCAVNLTPGAPALSVLIAARSIQPAIGPIVLSLSLRGLGQDKKKGSSFLLTAISSIAAFSPAFGAIADKYGIRAAIRLPTACFVVTCLYAFFVNTLYAKRLDTIVEKEASSTPSMETQQQSADRTEKVASSESNPR